MRKKVDERKKRCSTRNRTQDNPMVGQSSRACEARTIILTYMANLSCHELRVASLASCTRSANKHAYLVNPYSTLPRAIEHNSSVSAVNIVAIFRA